MPCKVEARGQNPETRWNWCPPSFNGFLTVCSGIHLSFLHAFYFKEEDMRVEQPSVMGGGLLNMTHQQQLSSLLPGHQYYSRLHVLDWFHNTLSPASYVTPPSTHTHIPWQFGAYRTLHRAPMDIDSTSSGSYYEQTVPLTHPSATTTGASIVQDLQSSASFPPQFVYPSETQTQSEFHRWSMKQSRH